MIGNGGFIRSPWGLGESRAWRNLADHAEF